MKIDEIVEGRFINVFESNLRTEICKYAVLKNVEADKIILEIRREIGFIPLIISGVAKVMRRDGKGNGIFLHYLAAKQISAMAISYALENKNSEIRIKSESNITYIAIPATIVNSWFDKYSTWRAYYIKQNQEQTSLLIQNINDISFENLEYRVVKYLNYVSLTYEDKEINIKHFDISRDLKVSREAISRVLKKLENKNIVSLGRNKITLN